MNNKVAFIAFASLLGVSPLSQAAGADTTPPNLQPSECGRSAQAPNIGRRSPAL